MCTGEEERGRDGVKDTGGRKEWETTVVARGQVPGKAQEKGRGQASNSNTQQWKFRKPEEPVDQNRLDFWL